MFLRNLNSGDTFRFAKGKATYILLDACNTDEMGWLVNFANTITGQRYQFQQPMWGAGNDITKREVIRIKSQAIKPKGYHSGPDYRYNDYLTDQTVEQHFGIKLSKKAIVKN